MDKPLRILHVVTIMDQGGIENMLMNLYRRLDRNKVQFDFLVHRDKKGFFDDEILSLGGKIHRVMPLQVHKLANYLKQLEVFFSIHTEYKIVHSHISVNSFFVLKQAKKNNIPIRIAHSHQAHKSIWEHRKKRIPIIWTLKKIINKPLTHRFACGVDAGAWLYGENKKFTVINNAIDTSLFVYNTEKAEQIKKEMGLSNSTVFGHVGRFNEQKNHFFLIKIFHAVKSLQPNSKLVLVGDGELRQQVEAEVSRLGLNDSVMFLGVRDDIPNLLQMMDMFLMPSFFEGLPVTLVEAQAAGLKVFASDAITREVALTDDITFLSLNESPEYWAEQILSALPYNRGDNSDIIKAKGYDIVESAKRLEQFYLEGIGKLKE